MRTSSRSAFTLIELVLALTILLVLVGAAVPAATAVVESGRRRATRAELAALEPAVVAFFEDTGALPAAVEDLERAPAGARGWAGPYLSASYVEGASGRSAAALDAWRRPYRVERAGDSALVLTSAGASGAFGDAADLAVRIDVTPARRARTLERLAIVNAAIERHNRAAPVGATPLPADYEALLAALVTRGSLPAAEPFRVDGWGRPFEVDPPGKTPVVAVRSSSLGR